MRTEGKVRAHDRASAIICKEHFDKPARAARRARANAESYSAYYPPEVLAHLAAQDEQAALAEVEAAILADEGSTSGDFAGRSVGGWVDRDGYLHKGGANATNDASSSVQKMYANGKVKTKGLSPAAARRKIAKFEEAILKKAYNRKVAVLAREKRKALVLAHNAEYVEHGRARNMRFLGGIEATV